MIGGDCKNRYSFGSAPNEPLDASAIQRTVAGNLGAIAIDCGGVWLRQSDLTNIPPRIVALVRERQPWSSADGKLGRVYGFADGAASTVISDDNSNPPSMLDGSLGPEWEKPELARRETEVVAYERDDQTAMRPHGRGRLSKGVPISARSSAGL